jgi:hypothetical protein
MAHLAELRADLPEHLVFRVRDANDDWAVLAVPRGKRPQAEPGLSLVLGLVATFGVEEIALNPSPDPREKLPVFDDDGSLIYCTRSAA